MRSLLRWRWSWEAMRGAGALTPQGSGNGYSLQILHDMAHAVPELGMCCWRSAIDLQLVCVEYSLERVKEEGGIVCFPQVDVDCMNLVHVFILTPQVEGWNVPLRKVILWT
jgi:hypothetical protein